MISQDDDLRKHFKCLPLSMLAFFDVVFVVVFFPICWFFFVFCFCFCFALLFATWTVLSLLLFCDL